MKNRIKSGPIPKRPPRRFAVPAPPLPLYLPMRYVRTEQYLDIWPNEAGSPYPEGNSEYPPLLPGWGHVHDDCFHEWLLLKNIESKWFHQTSSFKVKSKLLLEFVKSWDDYGMMPIPRPLWIQNYGGHRDRFYNPDSVNRLFAYILYFVDWLNGLAGAEKPKRLIAEECWFIAAEELPDLSKVRRSPMMTKYEHMMCDMYEAQDRQKFVLEQYMSNRSWFHRLTDLLFGSEYTVIPIDSGYNVIQNSTEKPKPKHKTNSEQMLTLGELFEEKQEITK